MTLIYSALSQAVTIQSLTQDLDSFQREILGFRMLASIKFRALILPYLKCTGQARGGCRELGTGRSGQIAWSFLSESAAACLTFAGWSRGTGRLRPRLSFDLSPLSQHINTLSSSQQKPLMPGMHTDRGRYSS